MGKVLSDLPFDLLFQVVLYLDGVKDVIRMSMASPLPSDVLKRPPTESLPNVGPDS